MFWCVLYFMVCICLLSGGFVCVLCVYVVGDVVFVDVFDCGV